MVSDPSWKSGPKERKPTATDHAITEEDFAHAFDFDGFGVNEAEMVDGEPLVAIRESVECHRDGCDAVHRRSLLFTTKPLSDDEKHALRIVSGVDTPAAYVAHNAERADVETIEVDGTAITAEKIVENEPSGSCFGLSEPSPDVDAYRYDL